MARAPAARRVTTTRGQGRCCLDPLRPLDGVDRMPSRLSEQLRDVLEPGDERRRQIDAGDEARARDARTSARRRPWPRAVGPRGSPKAMRVEPQEQRAEARSGGRTTRMMREQGSRAKVELTTRNSLMKMPSGGRPAMATTPSTSPQPSTGLRLGQAADVGDLLRALDLRDVADGEEDRRLGQRVHGHVQQPGEIGERPAHAEGEGDDAHVLDRGIGEHAFDVAPAVQHERGEHAARSAPCVTISGPGASAVGIGARAAS